VLTSS